MNQHAQGHPVWINSAQNLPKSRGISFDEEIDHVLDYLRSNHKDLYTGWPPPKRNEDEVVQIARALSYKSPEAVIQFRFKFLSTAIEIGNSDYGWNVPLVPQLVRLKKTDNWATPERFALRRQAKTIEEIFAKDLEKPLPDSPLQRLGQVLFCAIFFGCLLERKWLVPFLEAVLNQQIFQYNKVLWVEMTQKIKNKVDTENDRKAEDFFCKRFFPDFYSIVLLYRGLDQDIFSAISDFPSPWNCLDAYFKQRLELPKSIRPNSLNAFLDLSISRNLFMPGSLLAYATGKVKSTSLPIRPWLRCISKKAIENHKAETQAQQKKVKIPRILTPPDFAPKRQEYLFKNLLKILSPDSSELTPRQGLKVLGEFYDTHKTCLSPTFQLLVHWARQLLKERISYLEQRTKKKPLAVSSVRRYLRAINTPFLLEAANQDLTTIDPLDLELIYEQAILKRPKDSKAGQCLVQFHGFLRAFYGLPPIESIELKSKTAQTTNENANLITLDVYRLVLRGLGWNNKDIPRWQQIRLLAWILCYRCGFRPGEVLRLQWKDFQEVGKVFLEILIRASKTKRGTRRFPASLKLSHEELQFILDYYKKRNQEIGLFGETYLLAHPEQKRGILPEDAVFGETRQLLKSITKDETVRFYHARHTFNTALQAQLLLKGNWPGFIDLDVSSENDAKLRKALMANENLGRKDQYIQAVLVGHASPETTNLFYNHLTDYLLGCKVKNRKGCVSASLEAIKQLSGLSESRSAELLENHAHPLTKLANQLGKRFEKRLTHPLIKSSEDLMVPEPTSLNENAIPKWEDVVDIDSYSIKRGEKNWEMAARIYEGLRSLDGRRLKTAKQVVLEMHKQFNSSTKRWKGPTYYKFTEAEKALGLLAEIGIKESEVLLVHHPKRGQSSEEKSAARAKWMQKFVNYPYKWCEGEESNVKNTPNKGVLEIKIIHKDINAPIRRLPGMARGFLVGISLFHSNFSKVNK